MRCRFTGNGFRRMSHWSAPNGRRFPVTVFRRRQRSLRTIPRWLPRSPMRWMPESGEERFRRKSFFPTSSFREKVPGNGFPARLPRKNFRAHSAPESPNPEDPGKEIFPGVCRKPFSDVRSGKCGTCDLHFSEICCIIRNSEERIPETTDQDYGRKGGILVCKLRYCLLREDPDLSELLRVRLCHKLLQTGKI